MPKPLITCIFCGAVEVESSGEDIIPLWLQNKLKYYAEQHHPGVASRYVNYSYDNLATFEADTQNQAHGTSAVGSEITGARPTLHKLPDVCTDCNGGWMSRLEQAVGLLIPGLLEGKPKVLAPFDQLILATWVVKTCLVYDASYAVRHVRPEVGSRRLFQLGQPTPRSAVTICHDDRHVPEGAFLHSRQVIESPDQLTDSVARTLGVLFQFDCLILGATIDCSDLLAEGDPVLAFQSDQAEVIWPPRGRSFLWPTEPS